MDYIDVLAHIGTQCTNVLNFSSRKSVDKLRQCASFCGRHLCNNMQPMRSNMRK